MDSSKLCYICPECSASVVWSLVSGKRGASSRIICTNNPEVSKADWNKHKAIFCFWTGVVVRQRDGSVKLFDSDGVSYIRGVSRNT
jgi:hypothetical protein